MRTSEVFRVAAERVNAGIDPCCCLAIKYPLESLDEYWVKQRFFAKWFEPERAETFWWPDFSPKSQQERVLALLFAAAIAESEGD